MTIPGRSPRVSRTKKTKEKQAVPRVFETVVEHIQGLVLDGDLRGGDHLPTERVLAQKLGVSRASVREALRSLEIIGLIESRQGGGNFIRRHPGKALLEPLSLLFRLNGGRPEHILELRRLLEVEAASLAALRLTSEDRHELEGTLRLLGETEDETLKADLDKRMHLKIIAVSGNPLLIGLYDSISTLLDRYFLDARRRIAFWKEDYNELFRQHHNICEAIFDGDGDRAALEMRRHLELVVEILHRDI